MDAGGRPAGRPAYRPPDGMPSPRQHRPWRAVTASVVVHVAIALLLLIPAVAALIVHTGAFSAGGAGHRGGGGGDVMHGYIREELHYMESPPPTPPAPARPVPKPVVKPPEQKPPPTSAIPAHDTSAVAQAPGDGAGHNETEGTGPGTGGGTGAGAGTGVGPGTGPGKGPGAGESAAVTKIRAATDVMTLATIDPPARPRPFHLHALFAVDARGNARLLTVNKADDGDFNRAMRERLLETHFKAATLPNGTPVPDTVAIDIDY